MAFGRRAVFGRVLARGCVTGAVRRRDAVEVGRARQDGVREDEEQQQGSQGESPRRARPPCVPAGVQILKASPNSCESYAQTITPVADVSETPGRLRGRNRPRRFGVLNANDPNVDTPLRAPIKWRFFKRTGDLTVRCRL